MRISRSAARPRRGFAVGAEGRNGFMSDTALDIRNGDFWIDGHPTYPGRLWNGRRIEGLLLNSRMVQGIFDDLNPTTRGRWDYPDGPWDADRNTREFAAAMPEWRAHGLLAFTLNLQGGSPEGYSRVHPWHNSAFDAEGQWRREYRARAERILDRADELGMAVILGLFYFGQDERLRDEAAVLRATDMATDWLLDRGYRNVIVEICNETDVPKYEHEILRPARVPELLRRVANRSRERVKTAAGRLLVGVSLGGGRVPSDDIVAASDVIFLHGNGVKNPERIRGMADEVRARPSFRGQPIVFNEDDRYGFDSPDDNFLAALDRHASWGYFDFRRPGEGFEEGYQSVPVDWGIRSARKRAFFERLREIVGIHEH
jgi:hypothetical protein